MNEQSKTSAKTQRLHYLDWLQVLAILGVFLFHALHPFDYIADWHINNAESSVLATFFLGYFRLWGMPFFFLMAGVTSWFSLRRRKAGRYVRERVTRLLIPFIVGSIVLTPIQAYYELTHIGWWKGGSFVDFVLSPEARTYFYTEFHPIALDVGLFGRVGYHLWFVAFLFAFSLLALPLFLWLNQESGRRFVSSMARLAGWRGGLLVFAIPQVLLRLRFPAGLGEPGLEQFGYYLLCFISGYILVADERFMRAIRRDWLFYLIPAIVCTLFFFSSAAGVPVDDWMQSPGTPEFYVSWTAYGINSWCWTMVMLNVGMRFLNYTNKWLQYGRQASYPFFIVHQPVVIFVAFYAVQWDVSLLIKLWVVVIGSLAASLGLYELLVRRINPVRSLFGMKRRKT